MTRHRYLVSPAKGAWSIRRDETPLGKFPTQDAALDRAVELAREDRHGGADAQVIVQGHDGRFREERTYGHDPRRHPG